MMELIEKLKLDGESKGLCRLWRAKLKPGMDIENLVELYVKGIDFCISEDYPTLDFMRANFRGKSEQYGVYIDDDVHLENAANTVLNGSCKAMIKFDDYAVSRVFIRHDSQAAIIASDHAMITIDAFDDSKVIVATAGDNAQVYINQYGNAQIDHVKDSNNIHIRKMNRETY